MSSSQSMNSSRRNGNEGGTQQMLEIYCKERVPVTILSVDSEEIYQIRFCDYSVAVLHPVCTIGEDGFTCALSG